MVAGAARGTGAQVTRSGGGAPDARAVPDLGGHPGDPRPDQVLQGARGRPVVVAQWPDGCDRTDRAEGAEQCARYGGAGVRVPYGVRYEGQRGRGDIAEDAVRDRGDRAGRRGRGGRDTCGPPGPAAWAGTVNAVTATAAAIPTSAVRARPAAMSAPAPSNRHGRAVTDRRSGGADGDARELLQQDTPDGGAGCLFPRDRP